MTTVISSILTKWGDTDPEQYKWLLDNDLIGECTDQEHNQQPLGNILIYEPDVSRCSGKDLPHPIGQMRTILEGGYKAAILARWMGIRRHAGRGGPSEAWQ